MTDFDKINQLKMLMPVNCRLPLNPKVHLLAYDDQVLQLLSSNRDPQNHIAFLVLQPEQTDLIRRGFIHSVHCMIISKVGVILNNTCSDKTEKLLEHHANWVTYKNTKEFGQQFSVKFILKS